MHLYEIVGRKYYALQVLYTLIKGGESIQLLLVLDNHNDGWVGVVALLVLQIGFDIVGLVYFVKEREFLL